jgi:phosphoglycolate phosphatase
VHPPEAPRALLFDLDGTLVDTAADLVGALQAVRAHLGLLPLQDTALHQYASEGAIGLIRRGIPEALRGDSEGLRRVFLAHYAAHLADHSRPYPGARALLARCAELGIATAIVTNKPEGLARAVLKALELDFAVIVGGDTLPVRKPDPAPLHLALEQLGVEAAAAWMVGDDPRDIEAGRAAGCPTVAAAWGYLPDGRRAEDLGADWIAADLEAITQRLEGALTPAAPIRPL